MEQDEAGRITMSREELYELVWETPMRRLALRFGFSDVGLAKICTKHRIPRPARGHWARLEFGQSVPKAQLPPLAPGEEHLQRVFLDPHEPPEPGRVKVPRPQPVRLPVPEVLSNPHRLVEITGKSLRGARADDCGLLRPRAQAALNVVVGPDSVDRAMRILQALIPALEARGARVTNAEKEGPRQSLTEIAGESVPFSIREGLLRREKELTAAEKKERERFSWNRGPVYVYSPAGSLTFEVHLPSGKGARMRWSDGKKQMLEDHLARIVEAIFQFGEKLKEERRAAEERRRRREEWEKERAEKLRLIHEEEQRLKGLFAEVDAWNKSRRLRAYIRDVVRRIEAAQGPAQPGSSLQKWADWATSHADRVDPSVKAPPSILDEKAKWEDSYFP